MLINSLHLKNILSFKDTKLDLRPLNVLIGANGSGKSNLVDVIALLRAVPSDIAGFLRNNGPTGDWVWNGPERSETPFHLGTVETVFANPGSPYKADGDMVSGRPPDFSRLLRSGIQRRQIARQSQHRGYTETGC